MLLVGSGLDDKAIASTGWAEVTGVETEEDELSPPVSVASAMLAALVAAVPALALPMFTVKVSLAPIARLALLVKVPPACGSVTVTPLRFTLPVLLTVTL